MTTQPCKQCGHATDAADAIHNDCYAVELDRLRTALQNLLDASKPENLFVMDIQTFADAWDAANDLLNKTEAAKEIG